jgi:hypothetical protein
MVTAPAARDDLRRAVRRRGIDRGIKLRTR